MLKENQRTTLAEKLMDAGNIALAALVFGPFISAEKISIVFLTLGLVLYLSLTLMGIYLLGVRSEPRY